MSRIEAIIQNDIERQGRRLSLKSVICPNRVEKQAEAYFRCVGELPDGGQFTINVIQQDDQGTLSWDVPSSKVLINLASVEETIQDETKEALGKRLAIDCRDAYRVNQRGETFECDVVGAGTVAAGRVESVMVTVDRDGNLGWQEVLIAAGGAVPDPAAIAPPGTTAAAQVSSTPATVADDVAESTPKPTADSTAGSTAGSTAEAEEDGDD
ncbi:hypothetical protein VB741_05805 [Leptothoe sp. PORK10 BA2]|nr:hypothetical protein [Leptothoe sp. PORK10 BA2]